MNKRFLGKTGIEISEVGYGAAALFGKDVLGKQGITEEQAYEIIKTAINSGVTFFDTGINYGYAEERLGRCITRAMGEGIISRKDIVVETKCGEKVNADGTYGSSDWSPEWIKKSLEISLKRLQVDYIDLFAMHGGSIKDCTDELIYTFENLKSEGIIRAYGINTFETDVIEWVSKEKCFDYVMLDYNVMRQEREPIIKKLYTGGVGVIAGASLGQSLYKREIRFNRNSIWYYMRSIVKFKEMRKRSADFKFLNSIPGYTSNQLALRYVLDNEYISSAVFNTTSIAHLKENLRSLEISMPTEVKKRIQSRG